MFKAEVIAASRNTFGDRITSMLVTYPRSIHSEMCRHRMFSRNTASSRAIPFKKMVEMVKKTPFIPIEWQKDHKGMQGSTLLEEQDLFFAKKAWEVARDHAVYQAELMSDRYHVTKQIVNRILEPYMWTTELITATEWENFFALRYHGAAEIHMQYIAKLMLDAYNTATVNQLQPGEWHIPYSHRISSIYATEERVKISTAFCAGTSYTLFDDSGKEMNADKLVNRHNTLLTGKHMSPFEHCSQSMTKELHGTYGILTPKGIEYGWCKNFRGFIPYRAMIEEENQHDPRVIQ